ncbi:MAG: extracellular solute-binding protein [Rhodobacterales bacterium]|nr:extracellular solute-binding protein [Rhodobacterales bacterium]
MSKKLAFAPTRRDVMRTALAAGALSVSSPFVRRAEAATPTLRMLIWGAYLIQETIDEFESQFGAKVAAQFFDGNSEAFNKMRSGGTSDFDLVMADGFWPRLYLKSNLIQPVDMSKVPNADLSFDTFQPDNYDLLTDKASGDRIGVQNCWGSYGITMNLSHIEEADRDTLNIMFDEKYGGHLTTGARFEENIALAGILAATQLGTKDGPRPDGQAFNPYQLTDEELEAAKQLLIKQKRLLVTRYQDYDQLEGLMRPGVVWASPEFSETYRRLTRARWAGEIDFDVAHMLQPKEGGLGWVDSWQISSGTTDPAMIDLAHSWINHFVGKASMERVAIDAGTAPCYDIRDMLTKEDAELLMLGRTDELKGLHMFDQPSSPEKWERVWNEVEAA